MPASVRPTMPCAEYALMRAMTAGPAADHARASRTPAGPLKLRQHAQQQLLALSLRTTNARGSACASPCASPFSMDQQSRSPVASLHSASIYAMRSALMTATRSASLLGLGLAIRLCSVSQMSTCCDDGKTQHGEACLVRRQAGSTAPAGCINCEEGDTQGRPCARAAQPTVRRVQCTAAPAARADLLAPFPSLPAGPPLAAMPPTPCTGCAPALQSPAPAAATNTPQTGTGWVPLRPRLGSTLRPPAISARTHTQTQNT